MLVGLRVIKTAISIGISILVARLFHLEPDHFAGIISMLAVQPTVYRSLRQSLSHIISALLASITGIAAAMAFGNGSLVIALVCLLIMALLVRLRKTASLTLAIIVAINTMGTYHQLGGGNVAYNQFFLVLIGMTVGTAVNAIRKPVHLEREEVLLEKSESMLRVLLYYVLVDLQAGRMTPYKPDMRLQIEEVRKYIERGKDVSQLILEDSWLSRMKYTGSGELFCILETMAERIRDVVKALQKADLTHPECKRLIRVIEIIIQVQERMISRGKTFPLSLLLRAMHPTLNESNSNMEGIPRLFPYYQAYEVLIDYIRELKGIQRFPAKFPIERETVPRQ